MATDREPQHLAEVWWCGDEVCDCYQPQITLRTPNLTVGPPWVRITDVWKGTFISGAGSEDLGRMNRELAEECEQRGIPPGLSPANDVPWSQVEQIDREQMAEGQRALARLSQD